MGNIAYMCSDMCSGGYVFRICDIRVQGMCSKFSKRYVLGIYKICVQGMFSKFSNRYVLGI